MDIMGSWYNELEYIKKSKTEKTGMVKFRLVFRLRYPYELVQQFISKVELSLGEKEGRRTSVYEPSLIENLKRSRFSKVFNEKSLKDISSTLNVSKEIEEEFKMTNNMIVLLYYEVVYNFLKLRYNLYPVDFIQLLALKLRVDFGEFKESKEEYISTNFKAICPLLDEGVNEENQEELYNSIIEVYKDLKMSALDAMKRFLYICGKFDNFFEEMFPIKLFQRDDQKSENFYNLPDKCVVSIGLNGVGIYDEEYCRRIQFSFKDLLKWGYSEKLFILIIDEPEEDFPIKISFKTRMASNIVYSLNSICNLKRGKLPEENQLQMNRNVTREITENKFFKRATKFKVRKYFFE
jgi:hypothetical protein